MSDGYFDLYVWFKTDGEFYGFQLCYDKMGRERAMTWLSDQGFTHYAIDSGDTNPTKNCAPMMVADGRMPVETVREAFSKHSSALDAGIRELVISRLDEYGSLQRA